jgi:hypothetical protein
MQWCAGLDAEVRQQLHWGTGYCMPVQNFDTRASFHACSVAWQQLI